MHNKWLNPLLVLTVVLALPTAARAQSLGFETIKTVRESDPLIITGSIGTQSTFYHSSGPSYASPLSSSAYVNLNISAYGISMPFSFYYAGDNTSFSYPQFAFNFTPTYKGWTLLLGERSMSFSPYIYNTTFDGAGIEYQGRDKRLFRFGAFYGVLRKAINDDPSDPSARHPQYRRTGWGLKLGYGTSRNFLDFYLFRAQDHRSSIDEIWYDQLNAQENLSFGLRGAATLGRHLNLSANLAGTAYTTDITAELLEGKDVPSAGFLFETRYSSNFRMAGDVTLNTQWQNFSANLSYKQVQPDYTTLGVSHLTTNYQALSAVVTGNIRGSVLMASFSGQSDNLSGQQLYTTEAMVYTASASLPLGRHMQVMAAYNGYKQLQLDGTQHVSDTTRIDRLMNSYSLSPSLTLGSGKVQHNINVTGNFTTNNDNNPFTRGNTDVQTLAIGVGYSVNMANTGTTIATNFSHQSTEGYNSKFRTDIYSVTASHSFLEDKSLRTSATISLTDNLMPNVSASASLGGMLTAQYTLKKNHAFSLAGSYNRYNTTNISANADYRQDANFRLTFSYAYSFQAIRISRKGEDGKRTYESDWKRKPMDNSSAKAITRAVSQSERQQAAMRAIHAQQAANAKPKRF